MRHVAGGYAIADGAVHLATTKRLLAPSHLSVVSGPVKPLLSATFVRIQHNKHSEDVAAKLAPSGIWIGAAKSLCVCVWLVDTAQQTRPIIRASIARDNRRPVMRRGRSSSWSWRLLIMTNKPLILGVLAALGVTGGHANGAVCPASKTLSVVTAGEV